MKKLILSILALTAGLMSNAADFLPLPYYRWTSDAKVNFSFYSSVDAPEPFSVDARTFAKGEPDAVAAGSETEMPVIDGAVNLIWAPDSSAIAYTRANDLYVRNMRTGEDTRLTFDGSELILNGYASWVYYEEIFGRASRYCAFWWAPDSRKIAFYRFDNSGVPMFPIYSPVGQDGSLSRTRYPKAGEKNPEVKIGIIDLDRPAEIVWADFDEKQDQYFGTPFWGADSRSLFVSREPRLQNELDLYAVSAQDGSKSKVYHEESKTWLDWISGMIFAEDGLYMAREFESGWQQIYFLSYDGKELRRLTDGRNWRVRLLRFDAKDGQLYFTAHRDSDVKSALYAVDAKSKEVRTLTNPVYDVSGVSFSPDGRYFVCALSNYTTPTQIWMYETSSAHLAWKARAKVSSDKKKGRRSNDRYARRCAKLYDTMSEGCDLSKYALPHDVRLTLSCGLVVPGMIVYPVDFDPSKKYPVHVEIYGGPNTAYVYDRWRRPGEQNQWWSENGIIHLVADARSSGHNGREGLDQLYCRLSDTEVNDFVEWAQWLESLPYVQADKIGVEGFSFGGTMTARLLFEHSDHFHYGIAGGGVYDWALYDTHYTERFMRTPQTNPEGYENNRVIGKAASYPVEYGNGDDGSVMLKLTHGTGDDNVHFQNTLQLVDELQRLGKKFELMIYPDGMHGYRGAQGRHSWEADKDFWIKYLKN